MRKRIITIFFLYWGSVSTAVDVTPPNGWQQQMQTPPNVEKLFAQIKKPGEFSSNLVISRYKLPCCSEGKTGLDSLMRRIKGTQERVFPLYKIKEKGKRSINGINGAYLVTTYAKGELDIAALQFFFLQGPETVNVIYMCLLKDFEDYRNEFENSLKTLKLESKSLDKKINKK